jgi:5-(carboxyamino)imidazole ribonucleotide mutase
MSCSKTFYLGPKTWCLRNSLEVFSKVHGDKGLRLIVLKNLIMRGNFCSNIKTRCENMENKVVIVMGSEKDFEFCREIAGYLKVLGLDYEFRVASAHKTPEKVLEILKDYEKEKVVYVTVAGRSNALSAFVDANTTEPVIACPLYSEKFGGTDIYSSLRVPSGIGSLVTIEPEGAAIAAAKIFAVEDKELAKRVKEYQLAKKREIEKADDFVKKAKTV